MSPIVWRWSKGDSFVYTSNTREAAYAMRRGYMVSTLPVKRRFYRQKQL